MGGDNLMAGPGGWRPGAGRKPGKPLATTLMEREDHRAAMLIELAAAKEPVNAKELRWAQTQERAGRVSYADRFLWRALIARMAAGDTRAIMAAFNRRFGRERFQVDVGGNPEGAPIPVQHQGTIRHTFHVGPAKPGEI